MPAKGPENGQQAITELLASRIGLRESSLGYGGLTKPVAQGMAQLGLTDIAAYFRRLASDETALHALIERVVVPETSFFRNPESFDYLRQHVLSAASGQPRKHCWRILSLPCSTGEEPYSIAITLLEAGLPAHAFHIEGVDISTRALASAQRGRFTRYSFRTSPGYSPDQYIQRYFKRRQGQYHMVEPLRQQVQFHRGNLIDPQYLRAHQPYDIIFCRNVLIYLHQTARDRALKTLDHLLVPQGLLFVGFAETGQIDRQRFSPVSSPQAFAYQKRAAEKPIAALINANRLSVKTAKPQQVAPFSVTPFSVAASSVASPSVTQQQPVTDSADLMTIRDLMAEEQLTLALAQCKRYIEKAPASAEAYLLLGELYRILGQNASAESSFQKALYLAPECTEALIHCIELAEQKGDRIATHRLRLRLERRLSH